MRMSLVTRGGRGLGRRRARRETPQGHVVRVKPHSAGREQTATAVATKRRPDLQGVRALAVILVALNHANVPLLPGGYIGVDVFFVLSGYFITGLLLREGFGDRGRGDRSDSAGRAEPGHISIPKFYARRARRILPAATLTLALTSIAVYVVYDLTRANLLATKPTLLDAFAASLFYANIHFAAAATNYFAQASATLPSPVLHFWSLSVEEQFYLVWPSLLALTLLVCRRRRRGFDRRHAIRLVGLVIAIVCGASLYWSIHDTTVNPQGAYFSTFARAWELGMGAGLSLLAPAAARLPRAVRLPLGWIGAAMILLAAFRYSAGTAFPGYAALLPVGGAALIIVAGLQPTRFGIERILAIRPMRYIGDRSYTFYLWHFPMLVIVWQAVGHVLPVMDNLALLLGAFALSAFTFHFYENPLRFARWLRGWRIAAMVPVSLGASVAAIMIPVFAVEGTLAAQAVASERAHTAALAPARGQPDPSNLWLAKAIPQVGFAVTAARRDEPLPKAIVPDMAKLAQENTDISYDIPSGCQPSFGSGDTSRICRLGDPSSKHVVAVLGDSHAGMWIPALLADARAQKFAVVVLDKPGCFLSRVHTNLSGWPCATWYRWALRQDHRLHPTATIVSFELGAALQRHASSTVGDLRGVLSDVSNGVFLADPPGQSQKPDTCITASGATMRNCSTQVPGTYAPMMRDIAGMLQRTRHPSIPTVQWFCGHGICPMVVDHMLTTHDGSHLTMEYSAALAPLMGRELRPILARLERT